MKLIGAVVAAAALLGCGDDVKPAEVDAAPDVDAVPVDGPPRDGGACAGTSTAPPDGTLPTAGVYCAEWERIDGVHDAFARYYDRVEVTLGGAPALRWWSDGSSGQKAYDAAAAAGNCVRSSFSNGFQSSDPYDLCWAADGSASAALTWHNPGLADTTWRVRLSRFE